MNDLKVRLLANFPLSIAYGGFEHQCVQTCKALRSIGIDADLLEWHDEKEHNYILHLFAPDPMWARIVEHWGQRGPVVISAIAGVSGFRRGAHYIKKSLGHIAGVLRQETIYIRTRALLQQVDKIICLNELEQNYFIREYDLPGPKTEIIGNGVDESRYTTSGDIFVDKFGMNDFVLYVGNIIQRKNPLLLAESLSQMDLNGVFIGRETAVENNYARHFRKFIENSQNLIWIPGLAYDDPLLSAAFASTKVLCLPSIGETQPLVALEALAAGKPVILGDFPYAYQKPFENTVKVNPANKAELKSAIREVVNGKQNNIESLASDYRWNAVAKKLMQVYSQIAVN